MKGVVPSRWQSALSCSDVARDRTTGTCAPWKVCTGGRGLSVGSSRVATPERCCFQYASCASSTSPCNHWRCQTA